MSEKQFNGKVSQMKQSSKFLASEDFLGLGEIELTLTGVFEHADEIMQDGKKKSFYSIGFNDKPKRMVLNATNRKVLAAAFGADTTNWIGKKSDAICKGWNQKPCWRRDCLRSAH